jgi:hypothetical protein
VVAEEELGFCFGFGESGKVPAKTLFLVSNPCLSAAMGWFWKTAEAFLLPLQPVYEWVSGQDCLICCQFAKTNLAKSIKDFKHVELATVSTVLGTVMGLCKQPRPLSYSTRSW